MKLANDTIPLDKNIKTRPAPLRAPKFTHPLFTLEPIGAILLIGAYLQN